MVYDSSFYQHLSSIPESKGCHLFAVQERSNTLVVASKKKLTVFGWQSPGFMLRREISLVDIPKSICCVGGAAIVGYKKFYECVDLSTGTISRLLDVEKECKMVSLEVRHCAIETSKYAVMIDIVIASASSDDFPPRQCVAVSRSAGSGARHWAHSGGIVVRLRVGCGGASGVGRTATERCPRESIHCVAAGRRGGGA